MAYICLWSVGPSCCVPSGKLLSSEPHFSHFQNRGTHPHFSNGGFLSLPGGVSPLLWVLLHTVDQETSWDVVAQS